MPKVEAWMAKKVAKTNQTCTLENAAVRREWYVLQDSHPKDACRFFLRTYTPDRSDLSVPEREEYIKAVLCLQKLPAKAPKADVPGAVSRYDDFVATHMMQAMILHDTVRLDPRAFRRDCQS